MLLAGKNLEPLTQKLDKLISLINEKHVGHIIHSVIIKLSKNDQSVGKMTPKGSYTPYYTQYCDIQVPDEILSELNEIYALYRQYNATKHTLFFRYNQKTNAGFQMFANASMVLSSQVF